MIHTKSIKFILLFKLCVILYLGRILDLIEENFGEIKRTDDNLEMELNTFKVAFDLVIKKQSLSSSKLQELIDQVIHDIEQALSKIQSESISSDGQKAILTEVRNKIDRINVHKQLEASQKELNISLGKYLKLIEREFIPDISKAYRYVDFDFHTINQIIAGHFYRQGLFLFGDSLIMEAHESNALPLRLQFLEMSDILESMKERKFQPALNWVYKNREIFMHNSLSNLELNLHQQQCIEIMKKGTSHYSVAVDYARQYIKPFSLSHSVQVRKLMKCVLQGGKSEDLYSDLFSENLWDTLTKEFVGIFCNVLGQPCINPLDLVIKAGFIALPTLLKFANMMISRNLKLEITKELPVVIDLGREFQYHSVFVCPVSKNQGTTENPPMLMTCGHVLCKRSILTMIKKQNWRLNCPYCSVRNMKYTRCKQLYL